jgi:RimJ/RimL family protein N-acetyltransferase
MKKPLVIGKNIYLREILTEDAAFVLELRTNEVLNQHLSATQNDLDKQTEFIQNYQNSVQDFYFVICSKKHEPLGVVRIYDIRGDSFCWGSWIIKTDAPSYTAIESALLIYDFSFYALHYKQSHFDVRKANLKVISFHKKLGAEIVSEDDLNFYFVYTKQAYLKTRNKYKKFLPD